jgi:hypothetical protein
VTVEAFDPIVIKVKGDASDVLAMLAALKKAMREFEATSKVTGDRVSEDFKREGKSADEFGRLVQANMRDGKTALESLRLKSNDLRTEIGKLRAEFARTGNQSTFGDLRAAESDFKKISGYIKTMEGDAKKAAPEMRQFANAGNDSLSIFEELQGSMTSFGPLIALGVAALAPLLGGLAGGTVLSVLATGGLAAGIASQLSSNDVQSALSSFTGRLGDAWNKATEAFAPATAQALNTLEQFLEPTIIALGQALAHIAPYADSIAHALGAALQSSVGIDLAGDFQKLGPIFDALQNAIPVVIQGVVEFFNAVSDSAPAIANDIETIAHGFETLMNVGGHAIGLLSDEMAGIHVEYQLATRDFAGFAGSVIEAVGGPMPITSLQVYMGAEQGVAAATDDVTAALQNMLAEQQRVFDQNMALDGSELHMYESITALKDALRQNAGAWKITTTAGQQHRQALLQAIDATEKYYINLGKVNGVSPQLAAAYQQQIDKLLTLAGNAGLSADQIKTLHTQFDNLITVMEKNNGKPITIPVNVVYHVENRPSVGLLAGRMPFAQSGVYSPSARVPEHYDRSGVYAGRPGGYFMGEASTGEEALIGRASNPGRALAALATAAGWHDMAITPSRGGAFSGPQSAGGHGGGGGMAMADVYLDADKVGYAMIKWSGRFEGRSGVTIAGATASTVVGQAR